MDSFPVTERTRVRRLPQRATHAHDDVFAILDAGLVCHVGLVEDARPVVIPTLYARDGERLLLHGSAASRTMRAAAGGAELCLTVTLLDALVLARSAFHHSVCYRSAIVYGRAVVVDEPAEKMAALRRFTERIVPERWDLVREPNAQELKATLVLALPIVEAVAKRRTGGPVEDPEDVDRPVWAGVIPLATAAGTPQQDAPAAPGTRPPVRHWPLC